MKLPEKKSGINKNYNAQKIIMIGQSGIGKSEFWTNDPNAFFIQTEAGLNAYDVFKLEARSWDDLKQIYVSLKNAADNGKFPYTTIIVDTIDKVVKYAEEETVARGRKHFARIADQINSVGDIPNGGGWYTQKKLVLGFLDSIEQLPCAVAIVGHLTIKKIEEDSGNKYDKCTINIGGKTGEDILAWADHIMNIKGVMRGETLQRTVYTKPTQSREAKSRGCMIPDGMKWGVDGKVNYGEFRKLFT